MLRPDPQWWSIGDQGIGTEYERGSTLRAVEKSHFLYPKCNSAFPEQGKPHGVDRQLPRLNEGTTAHEEYVDMEQGNRAVSRKSVGFIFAVKGTAGSLSLPFLLVPYFCA